MKQAEGHFQDGAFFWPLRLYYEDTDAQGIVYYANYLRFIERARTEMFRKLDMSPTKIQHESGTLIVVRCCDLVFRKPARMEDEIYVVTRLNSIAGARLKLSQNLLRAKGYISDHGLGNRDSSADETLVEAKVELALIDANGRPVRAPKALKDPLERALDV